MIEDTEIKPKDLNPTGSWVAKVDKSKFEKKLVEKLHNREEFELYDLQKDPFEMVNLTGDSKYLKIQKKLKDALLAKLKALGDSDPMSTEKRFVSNDPKRGKKN
jgi:arylsulfatase A-like enzyme